MKSKFGKFAIDACGCTVHTELKFIYSEKATKFFEISTNYLSYVVGVV